VYHIVLNEIPVLHQGATSPQPSPAGEGVGQSLEMVIE